MSDDMRGLRLKVLPDTYNLIRINSELWMDIVADPALSPRMSAPFLIFKSEQEFLLMLDDADAMGIKARLPRSDVQNGMRVVEVRSSEGLRDSGSFGRLATIVSNGGFSLRCISSWDADFAVINQDELGAVLKLLSPFIEEIC